jgi:hypothetical protein
MNLNDKQNNKNIITFQTKIFSLVATKAFKIKVKPKIMVLYLWFGHQMLRPPNNILGLKTKKI